MVCNKCHVNIANYSLDGQPVCTKCLSEINKQREVKADAKRKSKLSENKCGFCSFAEAEFESSGMVGCSKCYSEFKSLKQVLKEFQGSVVAHKGK